MNVVDSKGTEIVKGSLVTVKGSKLVRVVEGYDKENPTAPSVGNDGKIHLRRQDFGSVSYHVWSDPKTVTVIG